jgi:hypothetical protein
MGEAEVRDDGVEASGPMTDESREGRVVIDFTVGPAGVGPVTSITPVDVSELLAEQPPAE